MKTLTPTLEAAQNSASALPYVKAVFSDEGPGGRIRLRFTRHYTGAEGEYFSAVTGAGDGSLVRARIDPVTKVMYTQPITSPGPSSSFSSWTSHGTVAAAGALALCCGVSSSTVYLFYVDADTTTLRVKTSTDNGATWGSAAMVTAAGVAKTYIAADVAPSGDVAVFWNEGATVYRSRFNGSWGARTAWTNSAASITGLACSHFGDWAMTICGTETGSTDAKVWACLYGDGFDQAANTWGSLVEVTSAVSGSNVSFLSPALMFLQAWRLFFVEKYTGSVAYSRLNQTEADQAAFVTLNGWREPSAFPHTGDYGVSCAVRNLGASAWLTNPAGVWSAPYPSSPSLDVSADVIEASVETESFGARARLVLRNDPEEAGAIGRYSDTSGSSLRRGALLELTPGYYTSEGAETPSPFHYWVESIETVTGQYPQLIVHARDAWWWLEQWRSRRQFTWPAGSASMASIFDYICSRAGLEFSNSTASTAFATKEPAFTINPGESARTAIERLMSTVTDVAIARRSIMETVDLHSDDDTVYAYGTGHPILTTRFVDRGPRFNRSRVTGAGVLAEAFDFDEIESVGERLAQISELNASTTVLAQARAETALRDATMAGTSDVITVFGVNCGQEIYDVVEVTDANAGLNAARRRVLATTWRYATIGKPCYEMRLTLGEP